jgi:hypothetical protein
LNPAGKTPLAGSSVTRGNKNLLRHRVELTFVTK